jgi:flagellar biosynthesis protein FliR
VNLIQIDQLQILAFTLVFFRCLGFFLSWPIFSSANMPNQLKVLLSLLMTFICFSLIKVGDYPRIEHYQALIGLAGKELLVGFAMGFLCTLIFQAVAVAGELVSMGMGLSAAQIFNPTLGVQQSSVNQLYFFLAAFLFLGIRGHHYFITGLAQSFELIPLSVIVPRMNEMAEFSLLGQKILQVGLLLSAPVLVSILLVNVSLGIVGRAVPQINVLITSLPVNALMGLSVLIIMLPFFIDALKTEIVSFAEVMFGFMRTF